ncbi:MAG: hypothetical protein ACI90V_012395 [Bacillariaceae sp.]|jgi:hypothetical protein
MIPTGIQYTTELQFRLWISSQRSRKSRLSKERIELLDSIGFEWEGFREAEHQDLWMEMFQRLISYKKVRANSSSKISFQ